jgi:hypothetical protein
VRAPHARCMKTFLEAQSDEAVALEVEAFCERQSSCFLGSVRKTDRCRSLYRTQACAT